MLSVHQTVEAQYPLPHKSPLGVIYKVLRKCMLVCELCESRSAEVSRRCASRTPTVRPKRTVLPLHYILVKRTGKDSNPRCFRTTVFKTITISLSDTRAEWRIGASNSSPQECKSCALPNELIPHALRLGFEPRTYRLTADCSTIELPKHCTLCRIRTYYLRFRRPLLYPNELIEREPRVGFEPTTSRLQNEPTAVVIPWHKVLSASPLFQHYSDAKTHLFDLRNSTKRGRTLVYPLATNVQSTGGLSSPTN